MHHFLKFLAATYNFFFFLLVQLITVFGLILFIYSLQFISIFDIIRHRKYFCYHLYKNTTLFLCHRLEI